MLVLTRKPGEKLVIGNNIVVTVVMIEGNKVRLGVEAPSAIRVDRQEVRDRRLASDNGLTIAADMAAEPV
ncbi:MAG: carbon storage regulator [Planctomycetes bacterium]|jgi:carbon storage regulator|nr:carbon storage regulator [Planctomycetota bacterium]